MNVLTALFEVAWGTVSLIEVLWTLGALAGLCVALWAMWRSISRSAYLQGPPPIEELRPTRRHAMLLANRDKLFRWGALGLVLEVAFWLGLWSMLEPQADGMTSSAAIAGLAFWLVELSIIAVVIHEEWTSWRIRTLVDGE